MRLLVVLVFCVVSNAAQQPLKVVLTQSTRDDRQNIQVSNHHLGKITQNLVDSKYFLPVCRVCDYRAQFARFYHLLLDEIS